MNAPLMYWLLPFNHIFYNPAFVTVFAASIAWLVLKHHHSKVTAWVLAVAVGISFILFPTQYPNTQGDGENGYCGIPYDSPSYRFSDYPSSAGRVQSLIHHGLSKVIANKDFKCHLSNIAETTPERASRNYSWMVMCAIVGVIVVLAMRKHVIILSLLLCAPWMLNAYGHLDSYIVPCAMVLLWQYCYVKHNRWALGVVTVLAIWSHPICVILTIPVAAKFVPKWLAVCWAVFVSGYLFKSSFNAGCFTFCENTYDVLMFLYGRLAMLLETGLFGLLVWILCRGRVNLFVGWSFALAIVSYFGLSFSWNMMDMLLVGMLGAIIMSCALISCDKRKLLSSGPVLAALSVFLFIQSVYCHNTIGMLNREQECMIYESSSYIRNVGPHISTGIRMPVDTAELKERKLKVFIDGYNTKLPHLQRYRMSCLLYYIAWQIELGREQEGLKNLEILVNKHPEILRAYVADGCFFTFRNANRCSGIVRKHLVYQ